MKYKISTLLILLAFMPGLLVAQKMTVNGTVRDEGDLPLPGVNIILKNITCVNYCFYFKR